MPRGIDNIRTHLANEIDNVIILILNLTKTINFLALIKLKVPLHVSLFTDGTKEAIMQMMVIMKDYGEVVCCFGSSHSIENNNLFSTANVA